MSFDQDSRFLEDLSKDLYQSSMSLKEAAGLIDELVYAKLYVTVGGPGALGPAAIRDRIFEESPKALLDILIPYANLKEILLKYCHKSLKRCWEQMECLHSSLIDYANLHILNNINEPEPLKFPRNIAFASAPMHNIYARLVNMSGSLRKHYTRIDAEASKQLRAEGMHNKTDKEKREEKLSFLRRELPKSLEWRVGPARIFKFDFIMWANYAEEEANQKLDFETKKEWDHLMLETMGLVMTELQRFHAIVFVATIAPPL